jgi:hypothetical protein
MAGWRRKFFLGFGLGAKALAKSVDEKSDDKEEADPADNSRRKHSECFLDYDPIELDHSLGFWFEHDLFRKPGSTFRDHALTVGAGAAVRAQFDGAVGDGEP